MRVFCFVFGGFVVVVVVVGFFSRQTQWLCPKNSPLSGLPSAS